MLPPSQADLVLTFLPQLDPYPRKEYRDHQRGVVAIEFVRWFHNGAVCSLTFERIQHDRRSNTRCIRAG